MDLGTAFLVFHPHHAVEGLHAMSCSTLLVKHLAYGLMLAGERRFWDVGL